VDRFGESSHQFFLVGEQRLTLGRSCMRLNGALTFGISRRLPQLDGLAAIPEEMCRVVPCSDGFCDVWGVEALASEKSQLLGDQHWQRHVERAGILRQRDRLGLSAVANPEPKGQQGAGKFHGDDEHILISR
jgi:hypothetical protein